MLSIKRLPDRDGEKRWHVEARPILIAAVVGCIAAIAIWLIR